MRRLYLVAFIHGAIFGGALMGLVYILHPVTEVETVTVTEYKVKWYRIDDTTREYIMDVSGDYDTDIDTMIEWEGVCDL